MTEHNLPNEASITKKIFENHMVIADVTVVLKDKEASAEHLLKLAVDYVENGKKGTDRHGGDKL